MQLRTEKKQAMDAEQYKVFSYIERDVEAKRDMAAVSLEQVPYFYRSSGVNSENKGTWFPCYGLTEGWIMKPEPRHVSFPTSFAIFLVNMFQTKQVTFPIPQSSLQNCKEEDQVITEKLKAFMGRFGNIQSLLFSYSIGGGYWNTKDSFVLRRYLDVVYVKELQAIKDNCPEISILRNPPAVPKEQEFFIDFYENPKGSLSVCKNLQDKLEEQRSCIEDRFILKIKKNDFDLKPPL